MGNLKYESIMTGLCILASLTVAGLSAYLANQYIARHEPKVLTDQQVKQAETVAKEIRVTQPAAQTIVKEIERSGGEAPAITYYVQSPTVEKAADKVAKQIETRAPEAPAGVLEKSDRTIVTPNTDTQKVDVYKISLRKAHKLKVGVTYVNSHAYLTSGYQAGRWEGLVHFDTKTLQPKGASVSYTVFEW